MYKYEDAIKILINKFSEMKDKFEQDIEEYEGLPYIFYETEFVKFIISNLENDNNECLKQIFQFVEELMDNGDDAIVNLVGVAILESLYFDVSISNKSKMIGYFKEKTYKSYMECHSYEKL